MDQTTLQKTPLCEEHLSLQAKMVPFGGWFMPVQYKGALAEYTHTREAASIFDTSHMGEFYITGHHRENGLDRLVTMSLDDLAIKSCRYGFILDEKAGVIDDLIVFRVKEDEWFVVVNGATIEKDREHFLREIPQDCFKDISEQTAKIDIQGPTSREILKLIVPEIEKLNYYTFDYFNILGKNILISRTGYTGELGYEIYPPAEMASDFWKLLLQQKGTNPAGLAARNILRLELGYSLYGHELDENVSPWHAGLMRFVDLEKDFIGKAALLEQKNSVQGPKSVGFISDDRRSPKDSQKLFSEEQKEIGFVTSGSFSPALKKGIGLGLVEDPIPEKGQKIYFGDNKNIYPATVSKKIFYEQGSLKK